MEPWEKLLQKADASLKAAALLLQHEMLAFAVSRAYYAMFYATKALLLRRGIQPRTHRGVITAFGLCQDRNFCAALSSLAVERVGPAIDERL